MIIEDFDDVVCIGITWDDLTDDAKEAIREALKVSKDDKSFMKSGWNWDIIPMAIMDISKDEVVERRMS